MPNDPAQRQRTPLITPTDIAAFRQSYPVLARAVDDRQRRISGTAIGLMLAGFAYFGLAVLGATGC